MLQSEHTISGEKAGRGIRSDDRRNKNKKIRTDKSRSAGPSSDCLPDMEHSRREQRDLAL